MKLLHRPHQRLAAQWSRFWLRALCMHWFPEQPTYRIPTHYGVGRMLVYRCPRCGKDQVRFV